MAEIAPWEKHAQSQGELVEGQAGPPWERHAQTRAEPDDAGDFFDMTPEDAFRIVDDFVRSMASGMTFGFADELAAMADTVTGLGAETFAQNLGHQRARDEEIDPGVRLAGEVTGAATSGVGLARKGFTLLNSASPTVASMAGRGAAEGALFGAAFGAGQSEGDLSDRASGAAEGAVAGAALGGATGAVGGAVAKGATPRAPTVKELKAASKVEKNLAMGAGVQLTDEGFEKIFRKMLLNARDFGFRPSLYPKASKVLKEFRKEMGTQPSLKTLEELRKVLRAATGAKSKEERALGRILRDTFMEGLTGLNSRDVVGGGTAVADDAVNSLKQYVSLWQRAKKGETVAGLIEAARDSASTFSGSGFENALRNEFKKLAKNSTKMAGFSEAERAAIQKVNRGGPIANVLRMIGKAAPTGIVSGSLGPGIGFAVAGPAGAVAVPVAGLAGRAAATVATRSNANAASELVRAGQSLAAPALSGPQMQGLQALIAAEAAASN